MGENAENRSLFIQSSFGQKVNAIKTCEDLEGIILFLNSPSVKEHLHVEQINYSICSGIVEH